MSKQSIITIAAAVVVFILILIFANVRGPSGTVSPGEGGGEAAEPAGPVTREAVTGPVKVPEATDEDVPENVAKPTTVAPAAEHRGGASHRSFEVSIADDQFTPDTVIVNIGDTVRINLTAVDGDYDYTQPDYGFSRSLARGETAFIQFDATAEGRYTIFCKSCGGPDDGPIGYLVVSPKE